MAYENLLEHSYPSL